MRNQEAPASGADESSTKVLPGGESCIIASCTQTLAKWVRLQLGAIVLLVLGTIITMASRDGGLCLLPPSPDPIVPEGVQPHQPIWYEPPVLPKPGESRFFKIHQGFKRLTSFQWDSTELPDRILPLDGSLDGLPITMRSRKNIPSRPNDWVEGGNRHISKRALDILLKFDPEAISWRPVITEFADGKMETYFIEIKRRINAIDFANSRIRFDRSEGYEAYPAIVGPARLLSDIPADVHIFSDARKWTAMFVSAEIRDAFLSLRPKPNMVFDDPGDGLPI